MEEAQRRALRRGRTRLVAALRVAPLWDPLEQRGVFTRPMLEELQSAGTRGEQARQLVIDLETRGKRAFPTFLAILRDTGQGELADMLLGECQRLPAPPQPFPARQPVISEGTESCVVCKVMFRLCNRSVERQVPGEQSLTRVACFGVLGDVYELKADPCGHCLILNNVNFSRDSNLSTRDGSNVDCEKLEKRFKALRFDVLTRRDLKAQVRTATLPRNLPFRMTSSWIFLLQTSHIQFPGGIYGTDGKPIPIEKIVNYFNGSQCPTLRGKPKLFFIQACGGEQRDRGFVVESDSPGDKAPGSSLESDATPFQTPSGDTDELDAVASLPTPSDILVSYSTFPGFVSWRETSSGSWYVETLDSVLEQYACSEDLLNMLLRVANAVSAKGRYKQIPGCFNFLRKKFFFMCK
ncbi:CASP9 protein, partial [Pterocles burchelli]|nr:CASP9 protein [Pterocles burchelli]